MIRGNVFKNWNKTCYIASKYENPELDDYGNEINTYSKPVRYSFNIQPASGDFETTLYGEKISKIYRAIVPIKYQGKIKEGDIAYLDGANPSNEVKGTYGANGNYVVDSIRPQNIAMAIYFRKIDK